jgi:sulfite reductase beta subunit-like hemoprotein
MVKSGREHLAGRVGERICGQEYAVLAAEFGPGIEFTLESLACAGAPACVLSFIQSNALESRAGSESARHLSS